MTTFALTPETVQAFYPLLPQKDILPDPEAGLIVLGAAEEHDGDPLQACGALVMRAVDEETWSISWLLVAPDFRRRGAGAALLSLAEEIAAATDMHLWCVFSEAPDDGAQGSLHRLFAARGYALVNSESRAYSISLKDMARESFFQRESKPVAGLKPLNEVPADVIAAMTRDLTKKGVLYVDPISSKWALGDISLVFMNNDAPAACVIFAQAGENTVQLSYVYADAASSMRLPMFLLKAHELLQKKFGPETELTIPCVTESSRKLVEKLLPGARVTLQGYCALAKPEFEET